MYVSPNGGMVMVVAAVAVAPAVVSDNRFIPSASLKGGRQRGRTPP